MASKPFRVPGPDHPITIEPAGKRVTVRAGGKIVAQSAHALALQEASYPVVYYLPRSDADMAFYERTSHGTHCPYKGDASYFSLVIDGGRRENSVWTYEEPHDAVIAIKDHLAFYPDRVDAIELG